MKKTTTTHKPAPAMPKAEPNEQPRTVFLEEIGPNKILVIKAVREVTGLGLVGAKNLVDSTDPRAIKEGVSSTEAEAIRKRFADAGATVEVEYVTTQQPPEAKPEATPTAAAATAEPEPLPQWATSTPRKCEYSLTMFGSDSDGIEHIDLTREEYITLKAFLAFNRFPGRGGEVNPDQDPR